MKFMLRGQSSRGRAQGVVSTLFISGSLNSRGHRHLGLLAAVLTVHDGEVRLEPDDGVQVEVRAGRADDGAGLSYADT